MYFPTRKYLTEEHFMRGVADDGAVLERLRVQRGRLSDRVRPPWWYLTGIAVLWALVFASPFGSRFLSAGASTLLILVAVVAVACVLQWSLSRATGVAVGVRNLRYRPARPARIAMIVVGVAALGAEAFLIGRGPLVAAIVVAVLAVVAEVAGQQVVLRAIRQDLRADEGVL
jgi:hypothetical protein